MILGIDPDSTRTSWALVSKDLKAIAVGVLKTKRGDSASTIRQLTVAIDFALKHVWNDIEVAIVEGQQYHHGGSSPVGDIIKIAQISGGLANSIMSHAGIKVAIPTPSEWKKSVPKAIHQARTFERLGILYQKLGDYSYPTGCAALAAVQGASSLPKGDWKHVGDALGLAVYGAQLIGS